MACRAVFRSEGGGKRLWAEKCRERFAGLE